MKYCPWGYHAVKIGYLILKALQNKYDISSLEELDDSIEMNAHKKILKMENIQLD